MWTTTFKSYVPYTVGLDETFNRLEALAGGGTTYPPHNIVSGDNGRTILEIALAGFSREDISVSTERNLLTVSAKVKDKEDRKYQHKGISDRAFEKSWQLGEDVEVDNVEFVDGLLSVVLKKQLPEKQKRKVWF